MSLFIATLPPGESLFFEHAKTFFFFLPHFPLLMAQEHPVVLSYCSVNNLLKKYETIWKDDNLGGIIDNGDLGY